MTRKGEQRLDERVVGTWVTEIKTCHRACYGIYHLRRLKNLRRCILRVAIVALDSGGVGARGGVGSGVKLVVPLVAEQNRCLTSGCVRGTRERVDGVRIGKVLTGVRVGQVLI